MSKFLTSDSALWLLWGKGNRLFLPTALLTEVVRNGRDKRWKATIETRIPFQPVLFDCWFNPRLYRDLHFDVVQPSCGPINEYERNDVYIRLMHCSNEPTIRSTLMKFEEKEHSITEFVFTCEVAFLKVLPRGKPEVINDNR